MKEKEIEKVPYIGLKKISRGKKVHYIARTMLQTVKGEKHFFLEVYKNVAEAMDVPVIRIVCTKKDFGNYWPQAGKWTSQNCRTDNLLWDRKDNYWETWDNVAKNNILSGKEDLDRIKQFFQEKYSYEERYWWNYISEWERNLTAAKNRQAQERKWQRQSEALKERIRNTAELQMAAVTNKADSLLFYEKHYLYYKKKGNYAQIACSACGEEKKMRWREGMSYESQFEPHMQEPVEGRVGRCPMCNKIVIYKCIGRAGRNNTEKKYLFLGEKYKKTGFVLRYVKVSKEWNLQELEGNVVGAEEKISGCEIARVYYEDNKKVQVDYNKYNPYTGKEFWDYCNLYGLENIQIKEAYVSPETYINMRGTIVQYSEMREYAGEKGGTFNAADYLTTYMKYPQIEVLVKMGLYDLVAEIIRTNDSDMIEDKDAESPDKFLGINKTHVKRIVKEHGNTLLIRAAKTEKELHAQWTDEQISQLAETNIRKSDMENLLKHMTITKLLNRIRKYAKCGYAVERGEKITIQTDIVRTAGIYVDYIKMREDLGYDLNNLIYQYPRDLFQAHEKMVLEANEKELDKKLIEAERNYPSIKKQYRKLRRRLHYQDENYLIRPAKSATEIVIEGRLQHHCVGGNNYLSKHDKGISYILLLRKKENPDMPYITVELDGGSSPYISQWYGAYDKKPDEDEVQKWLDEYIEKLRTHTLAEVDMDGAGIIIPAAI